MVDDKSLWYATIHTSETKIISIFNHFGSYKMLSISKFVQVETAKVLQCMLI